MQKNGFVILMTGLSGAGKSTIAQELEKVITKEMNKYVTLIDGDVFRDIISPDLSFSIKDRELNIRRMGYIAGEVLKHNGICICAAIAPVAQIRNEVKDYISQFGKCYEVNIATSLEVCEKRDPKGLYKKVRNKEIKNFTGIDSIYEIPFNPDLKIDTESFSVKECVKMILNKINK